MSGFIVSCLSKLRVFFSSFLAWIRLSEQIGTSRIYGRISPILHLSESERNRNVRVCRMKQVYASGGEFASILN